MPPVLGPVSPSPMRLKSCAGARATARRRRRPPAATAPGRSCPPRSPRCGRRRRTPRRPTWPARPRASSSVGDEHALAGRQAVGLDHPRSGQRLEELERRLGVGEGAVAGGRHARRLEHLLHPRLRALEPGAVGSGAEHQRPAARSSSASPSTSGASGPITYRSASTSLGRRRHRAGDAGVARRHHDLGGAGQHVGERVSRPPDPTTQTFTARRRQRAARI